MYLELNEVEEVSIVEEEHYECDALESQIDKVNEYYYGYDSSIRRVEIKKSRDLFK